MLTVTTYILLKYFFGNDWSETLIILTVLLDLVIIDKIEDWRKK